MPLNIALQSSDNCVVIASRNEAKSKEASATGYSGRAQYTEDGIETAFATEYLGHFLMAAKLCNIYCAC